MEITKNEINSIITYLKSKQFPESYSEYLGRVKNEHNILCKFYRKLLHIEPSKSDLKAYKITSNIEVYIKYLRDLLIYAFEIYSVNGSELRTYIKSYDKTKKEITDLLERLKEKIEQN